LLLVIALFVGGLVAEIPVAVISGVLLGTSLRIANPESIKELLRTTKVEQITYLVTAVSVVAIDLIWGTIIGIATHFVMQKITKQR
jgi:SulP family sulfate permease